MCNSLDSNMLTPCVQVAHMMVAKLIDTSITVFNVALGRFDVELLSESWVHLNAYEQNHGHGVKTVSLFNNSKGMKAIKPLTRYTHCFFIEKKFTAPFNMMNK